MYDVNTDLSDTSETIVDVLKDKSLLYIKLKEDCKSRLRIKGSLLNKLNAFNTKSAIWLF